jgi:6-phosphogluconolactonase
MTALQVHDGPEEVARAAADFVQRVIRDALDARGQAHLALAGGNTPRRTYELLADEIDDWRGIELWFGDERAVGADDPESNYRMVRETLVERGGVPPAQVHRMEGERDPDAAAADYERLLRDRVPAGQDGIPALDLAFEGIGEDGHTASLFPGNPVLEERGRLVAVVHDSPKPPPTRLTLTLPVLQAARNVLFVAEGSGKAGPVAGIVRGPDPSVPSSLLGGERTTLIVDRDAAADAE